MKSLKTLIGMIVLVITLVSCSSSDNSASGNMTIKAKATYNNSAAKSANDVVLTGFKVNIREIEFELAGFDDKSGDDNDDDQGWDDNGFFDGDDEVELNGPWELDLLNQTVPVTTVTVPNGTYEEVEFKLSPSLVATSPIFGKTVEITGTINGTPFVFWHNFNQKFEIDYEDANQNLVIADGSYELVFNFDLNQIISSLNLSAAVDGDGDGLIEIGPDDTDGNNALAEILNNHMHEGCHIESEHD